MRLVMISVNHRTAPVELREKVALANEQLDQALDHLRRQYPVAEVVVLSTCNRTELYTARPSHQAPSAEELRAFLARTCGVDLEMLRAATIQREQEEAVGHLFRVSCGLESMVLGEAQVLGQIKRAYGRAAGRGTVGPVLHRVFQDALAVAKQVRTQTGIGEGRLSVGSIATDFARQIFGRFDDKVVLGIGAGEMAKLTLRHLQALRPAKLWITNRSPAKAQSLSAVLGLRAEVGGARPFEDLNELLVEADIVLTSTGSSHPIITADQFKPLLKRRRFRPIFIIDIAVPRDVESTVGSLRDVYLYNIDDLQGVASQSSEQRAEQVEKCHGILRDAVASTLAQVQHRDVGQVIRALRQRLQELGEAEQARTARKLAATPPEELPGVAQELLAEHTHRLINKFLHLPLSQLDPREGEAPLAFYAAALRKLFAIEYHGQSPPPPVEIEEPIITPDSPTAIKTPGAAGEQPARRA